MTLVKARLSYLVLELLEYLFFLRKNKVWHRRSLDAALFLTLAHVFVAMGFLAILPKPELVASANVADYPIWQLIWVVFREESLYRALPLLIGFIIFHTTGKDIDWPLGFAAALLYAYGHLTRFGPLDWEMVLIPFAGGIIKFWLAKNKGLQYAYLEHFLYNLFWILSMFIIQR